MEQERGLSSTVEEVLPTTDPTKLWLPKEAEKKDQKQKFFLSNLVLTQDKSQVLLRAQKYSVPDKVKLALWGI